MLGVPFTPLPLPLPDMGSFVSQAPPSQFLVPPSLRPCHSPHPMLSRQNQASAMSPTAHMGNCRDGGQIRWWRGRVALRSTQNIPSAFSNHSWSTYSFCSMGWAAEAVPDQQSLGGTQGPHLPPQLSATPPNMTTEGGEGPAVRGGPGCARRGLAICALPLSWSQRHGVSSVGNEVCRRNVLRAGRGQGTQGFLMTSSAAQLTSNCKPRPSNECRV